MNDAFTNLTALFIGGIVIALSFTAVDRLFNRSSKPKTRHKK